MIRFLKLIVISLLSVCTGLQVMGQSYDELALIFSTTQATGTTRIMGLGGAQTSLGGDPSLALSNPAGLGMANRSSLSMSFGFNSLTSASLYYGDRSEASRFNFNLPQLGLIFHQPARDESSRYRGGSFAVNIARTDTYQQDVRIASDHGQHSLIDYMLNSVDGLNPVEFQEGGSEFNSIAGLGWYAFVIDTLYDEQAQQLFYDSYVTDFPDTQTETINVRGAQYTTNLSYGGNYDDKIFFGAGLGITSIRYNSVKTFEEEFSGNSLRYLGVLEELSVSGKGVNLNLGVIVRPVSILQVGASFTSRTLYNINDTYTATLEADWAGYTYPSTGDQLFVENIQSDLLITDYRLRAPAHWRLGATVFLGKSGFITADYGQVNYGNSRLSSGDFSMDPENNFIENNYGRAGNARLGAEFRYKILRIRGGAGFYGDPRQEDIGVGSARQVYSFGIGIMKRDFYLDAALINTRRGYAYLPYDIGNNEAAEISQSLLTTQLTMGFNF